MKYTELMKTLDTCCLEKIEILIFWDNGLIIKSSGNTGAFETDNGLDLEDDNYIEYYACAVGITEIIHRPVQNYNPDYGELTVGTLLEVSELNEPYKIENLAGTIIWQREKDADTSKHDTSFWKMDNQYKELLFVIDDWFQREPIIIEWSNGLKVKCRSFTGISETDTEPGDEDYIGEYSIGVNEVEILEAGTDDSVEIYKGSIEISLLNIPERITQVDGTVLWQREQ